MEARREVVRSQVDHLRQLDLRGQESSRVTKGMLFPESLEYMYPGKLPKNAMNDYVENIGDKWRPDVDYIHMDKYLKLNETKGLHTEINGLPVSSYLPGGHTLIDYLNDDLASKAGGWQYPSKSALPLSNEQGLLTMKTLNDVKVMEVIVAEEIPNIREFTEFVTSNLFETANSAAMQFISMDCESIQIPNNAKSMKLFHPETIKPEDDLTFPTVPRKGQSSMELPVKFMFGDGIKWMAVISFPHEVKSPINPKTRDITIRKFNADQRLAVVIDALPTMVGRNVLQDVKGLHAMFNLYGIEASIEKTVDVAVLALLAGWDLTKTSLFALHLVTTGCALNKVVSMSDFTWHLKYSRIQPSMKVYMIGDVRSGYLAATVLLSILVRDMFPDPDVVCSSLRIPQKEAFSYIADMILYAANNIEPKQPNEWSTGTRLALANNIRVDDDVGVPKSYRLLVSMIPQSQFAITSGGPRFLHPAREKFERDLLVLKMLRFVHPTVQARLDNILPQEMESHIRYGRPISDVDQGCPVFGRGLKCHPDLAGLTLQLHGEANAIKIQSLYFNFLEGERIRCNRSPTNLIREYCRLYPRRIDEIMLRLNEHNLQTLDLNFWMAKHICYSKIRQTYYFLMDQKAARVPAIEDKIGTVFQGILGKQRNSDGSQTPAQRMRETMLVSIMMDVDNDIGTLANVEYNLYQAIPTDGESSKRNQIKKAKRNQKVQKLQSKGVKLNKNRVGRAYNLPRAGLDLGSKDQDARQALTPRPRQRHALDYRTIGNPGNMPSTSQPRSPLQPSRRHPNTSGEPTVPHLSDRQMIHRAISPLRYREPRAKKPCIKFRRTTSPARRSPSPVFRRNVQFTCPNEADDELVLHATEDDTTFSSPRRPVHSRLGKAKKGKRSWRY